MIKEIYRYIFHKSSLLLTRKQLGSMEPHKITDSEEDRSMMLELSNAYRAICWMNEKLIEEQKDFQAYNCQTIEQVLYSRGTINGLELMREFIDSNRELPEN